MNRKHFIHLRKSNTESDAKRQEAERLALQEERERVQARMIEADQPLSAFSLEPLPGAGDMALASDVVPLAQH